MKLFEEGRELEQAEELLDWCEHRPAKLIEELQELCRAIIAKHVEAELIAEGHEI